MPVVGIGGVVDLDDVLDYLAAGATAVGMATAALADPAACPGGWPSSCGRLVRASHGVADVRELVGAWRPAAPSRPGQPGGSGASTRRRI